jgi:tetratricopeptide (TPR) repeat protein
LSLLKNSHEGLLTYSNDLFDAFSFNMSNPHILIALGEIFLQRGDIDRASKIVNRGIGILSKLQLNEGRKDSSVCYSALLVLSGKIHENKKEVSQAYQKFKKASEIDKKNPIALYYLGNSHMNTNPP